MIEKHQQTNGIGRGKITINPEYIKRAREITVGGLPIKVLSSNPNTGRVLAQFPDGHTEEVKAAPDYFIGGNTSTKELKNNLPVYGETNTAANERADSLDEAHDLTPIFSNLITAGQISTMNEGALDLLNGKYLEGATKLFSPAMFGSGIGGIAARSGIGGYNLFNKNGVRKTYNLFNLGHYGEGALSLLGDTFNAAMAAEGLGSTLNTLKGTSGYRNWRLARKINQVTKNKPKYTKVPSKNLFRTQVYKGGEITDPYSNFVTTDPLYAANYGLVTPYIFESKSIAKAREPMMGSSDPVTMDMFVYNNTKHNPNATAIIGHDKITGEFPPSKGIEILNMNPKNLFKINNPEKEKIFTEFEGQQLLLDMLTKRYSAPYPPSNSLKFFERPQSKISEAERLGIPKGERNFKPKWHVANYPGYLLKGLMKGSLLEKQLSKKGTININLLNAYFNKASQIEREVANKVLSEKFAGLKTIDYNLFKKAVLDELIGSYNRVSLTKYLDYGIDRIGYKSNRHIWEMDQDPNIRIDDGLPVHADTGIPLTLEERVAWLNQDLPRLNTFTFESPRIPVGNSKHYDTTTLGHSRTYTTPEEPKVLHVMESQSDWGQHPIVTRKFTEKYLPTNEEINSHNIRIIDRLEKQVDPKYIDEFLKLKYYALKVGADNLETVVDKFSPEFVEYIDKKFPDPFSNWSAQLRLASLRFNKAERSNFKLLSYLHDNYLQRQLQENLKYASEHGQTKMRYPTSETAAKIEGYLKINHNRINELSRRQMKIGEQFENGEITYEEYNKLTNEINELKREAVGKEYSPEHQTILKKYANFPKLFLKLFKDLRVRTVTDTKGNAWYEVDVPKGYLSREWLFKQGGKMNILEFLKNGSGIHIKKKNRGKFTDYCGGKVTDECIRKAKASGNPTLVKRATFAANARKWKHKDGGKAFVNGVNVLDSNPKMYKYNKKYKMAQEGAKLTFWQQAGNWIKDNLDSISTIGNGISNLISAKNRLDEINLFAQAKQKELKAFKYKTWKDKYLSNLQNQTDRSDIVNAHNAFNLTNINDALQEKLDEINNLIANLLYLNNLQDTGLGDITSGLLGIATNVLLGTTQKKKIYNTFNPLANQTMNLIRGKLLDINANFSE